MADVIITANDSTTYTLNAGDDYLLVSGVTHYTSQVDVQRFDVKDKQAIAFQLESLILAQNERWRQA